MAQRYDTYKHTSFFFNDTATTEIYTLSLHDALPIFRAEGIDPPNQSFWYTSCPEPLEQPVLEDPVVCAFDIEADQRSEEHTSELQSRQYLVCRLLLEKKKFTAPPSPRHTLLFAFTGD